MRLCSRAHLEAAPGELPALTLADLASEGADLVALTGGPQGALDSLITEGRAEAAEARLKALAALFPERLYVEIQRHGTAAERAAEGPLLDLAYRLGLPLVATNEPFFATRADFEAHDALLVHRGGTRREPGRAPPPDARALFQDARGNARAFRRSAGSAGEQRRDRAALRLSPGDAQPDHAAFSARGAEAGREQLDARRPRSCAGRRATGSKRASPPRAQRPRSIAPTMTRGSTSSSASSRRCVSRATF